MLKTIQTKLIHLLGGYTKEEYKIPSINVHTKAYQRGFNYGFELGSKNTNNKIYNDGLVDGKERYRLDILCRMAEIYGVDKQTWINKLYDYISQNKWD